MNDQDTSSTAVYMPDKILLSDHRQLSCPIDARPSRVFKDRTLIDKALGGELLPRTRRIVAGPGVDGSGGDFVKGVVPTREKEKEKEKVEEDETIIIKEEWEDGKEREVVVNPAIALDGDEEILCCPISSIMFATPRLEVKEGQEETTSYSRVLASKALGERERVPLFNLRDLCDAAHFNSQGEESLAQFLPRALYRSACISRGGITKEEAMRVINFIKDELQIRTIIDLRDKKEKTMDPHEALIEEYYPTTTDKRSTVAKGSRRRYNIPLMTVTLKVVGLFWDGSHTRTKLNLLKSALGQSDKTPTQTFAEEAMNPIGLFGLNKLMLIYGAREIAEVLRVCANESLRPIMYHCSSGKDRTGLITALLLAVCEVPEEHIIEDYYKSEVLLQPVMHLIEKENSENGLIGFDGTPPEVMRATFEYIRNEWGSVRNYLKVYAGLSESEMDALKSSLLCLTVSGGSSFLYSVLATPGTAGTAFNFGN